MLFRLGCISAALLLTLTGCDSVREALQLGGAPAPVAAPPPPTGCESGEELVTFTVGGRLAPLCLPVGVPSAASCTTGVEVTAPDGRRFCFARSTGPGCPASTIPALPPTTYEGPPYFACRIV